MHTTIKTMFDKGISKSEIARLLGVDRKTVRKVLSQPKDESLVKKPYPSIFDKHRGFIESGLAKHLSGVRIYQDLVTEFKLECAYSSLRDYIRKIKVNPGNVYMVLNCMPGEEAQVDFGYIGTLKINSKHKKAWIFIMTLSYSRYMYAQIVFDQSVKTFIMCHINAFKYFNGVPETVKIDNLKAGIVEANFYEPIVQRNYASFAAYYAFWAQPCRVRTPTDKGKVESNVDYVKNNCFKGRDFENYENAKEFLANWLKTIANVRVHGTTKKIPEEMFKTKEQQMLKELPSNDFVFSSSQRGTVNTNCHFSYKGSYYSAPYQYIGLGLELIEINNLLKAFHDDKEIATHVLWTGDKGQYVTNTEHYPSNKNITSKEILDKQREEMIVMGCGALNFFDKFSAKEGLNKYDYRSISGILALRKKYTLQIINDACQRAAHYGSISYMTVKRICEKGLVALPIQFSESYINVDVTELTRNLSEYTNLCELGGKLNE